MLETPRLLLRPMTADDADALLLVFSDPRVVAAFGVAPFGMPQLRGWLERNLRHQASHGYGLFAVLHKADGVLIGDCGLTHLEIAGQPELELGYDLRSDYWNRGLATEAARAVRDYAFCALSRTRLVSLICTENAASRRVAKKVGMERERAVSSEGREYQVYTLANPARAAASPRRS